MSLNRYLEDSEDGPIFSERFSEDFRDCCVSLGKLRVPKDVWEFQEILKHSVHFVIFTGSWGL